MLADFLVADWVRTVCCWGLQLQEQHPLTCSELRHQQLVPVPLRQLQCNIML